MVLVHIVVIIALAQLSPELRKQVEPVWVSSITTPQPDVEPLPSPQPLVAQPKIAPQPGAKLPSPAAPARPRESAAPAEHASATPLDHPPPTSPAPAALSAEPVPSSTAVSALSRPSLPVIAPRFDVAYLNNPRPEYPRIARRLGEHGRVTLHVFVSPAGLAEKIEIGTSSGYPRLDQAAREAVRSWKFVPARQGEQAVGAWVLVPISFVLEG